jgi:hypothetical protein
MIPLDRPVMRRTRPVAGSKRFTPPPYVPTQRMPASSSARQTMSS